MPDQSLILEGPGQKVSLPNFSAFVERIRNLRPRRFIMNDL